MSEIIKITEKEGKQVLSARELYIFLSGGDMSNVNAWMTRNIENNKFATENIDYQIHRYINERGQGLIDYAITVDFGKELCMMSQCESGKIARQYFIEVEKKYKQNNLPTSYLDALKALVISEEQKQLAESKVLELEPKAEVFDKLSNGINHLTFADASKSLNWGRNTLLKVLRNRMILRHNNTPYQRYIDEGYFVVKISPINISGTIQNTPQTYVTAKGLIWLSKTL